GPTPSPTTSWTTGVTTPDTPSAGGFTKPRSSISAIRPRSGRGWCSASSRASTVPATPGSATPTPSWSRRMGWSASPPTRGRSRTSRSPPEPTPGPSCGRVRAGMRPATPLSARRAPHASGGDPERPPQVQRAVTPPALPLVRQGAELVFPRAVRAAQQALHSRLEPQVAGREDVGPAQPAHQDDLGGPAADARNVREPRDRFLIGEVGERAWGQGAGRRALGDFQDIARLLPAQAQRPEGAGRRGQQPPRRRIAQVGDPTDQRAIPQRRHQPAARGLGRRDADLLPDHGDEQRLVEIGRPDHPQAGAAPEQRRHQRIAPEHRVAPAQVVAEAPDRGCEAPQGGRGRDRTRPAAPRPAHHPHPQPSPGRGKRELDHPRPSIQPDQPPDAPRVDEAIGGPQRRGAEKRQRASDAERRGEGDADGSPHGHLPLDGRVHFIYLSLEMSEMQLVSRLARALADETRLRILLALSRGEATVSDLSARLGLGQPRVSTHLALLRRAGLVSVRPSGRSRAYRVDARRVAAAVRALRSLLPESKAPVRSPGAGREVRRNSSIRRARSCYDHLAGVAGVGLLDALLRRRWLVPVRSGRRVRYALTPTGDRALGARSVEIARARRARRMFAYGC